MPRSFVVSRVGARSQTVLPKAVREALGVRPGDQVGFLIRDGQVTVTAVRGGEEQDDPFAHFEEWSSEADRVGYGSL